MKNKNAVVLLFCAVALSSMAMGSKNAPMPTAPAVDLSKYDEKWFEQYRIPNSFQDNTKGNVGVCYDTTAEYSLRSDGKLDVLNTCYRFEDSRLVDTEQARAVGKIQKDSNNAKLKVNFTGIALLRALGIGDGNYWVLGLGPVNSKGEYSWALVGEPKRKYGWILSRDKRLSETQLENALDLAVSLGYSRSPFQSFVR